MRRIQDHRKQIAIAAPTKDWSALLRLISPDVFEEIEDGRKPSLYNEREKMVAQFIQDLAYGQVEEGKVYEFKRIPRLPSA